jgi:uncharacterized protein (DUF433 family)
MPRNSWFLLDPSTPEIQPRKRRALEGIQESGTQLSGGSDRPRQEIQFFQRTPAKYRPLSPEEWLAERARHAMLMLRDCAEVNPRKRGGVPVLKGTRFTLAQILAEIAEGRSVTELAEDFDLDLEIIKQFLEGLSIYFDRPAFR